MPSDTRAENASRPRQRVSRAGLELIKSFEGLRRRSARLPGGRYVVGYGHIRSAREGVEVSETDAEALLRYDLLPVEAAINEWVFTPLSQNQFDALCSFAFSIGLKTFRGSDVLRRLNEGAMLPAAAALEMWRRVELDGEGIIVDALVRRRAAEKALFLKPTAGHVPAPRAVLKPRVDFAAYGSLPRQRPEEVETPLDGDEAVALRTSPETEETPESDWSPAKAAAATVSARLTELLAEQDPAESELDRDFDTEVEPVLALEPEGDVPVEALDGDFMQAPPSPRETAEDIAPDTPEETIEAPEVDDEDHEDAAFPELDLEPLVIAPFEVVEREDELEAPVAELSELPPFPQDADLPVLDLEGAEPVADDLEPESVELSEGFGQNSGALPSQGDPAELARPLKGSDNGPYIYLFLAGLALVVAAAVTFFRTPEPGAATGSGLGWVLGLLGIAGVAGALWAIMGREDALGDEAGGDNDQDAV